MKYEKCKGACDYCFYAKRNKKKEIIGCAFEPPNDLRNDLAINHHYCRHFMCEYAKGENQCQKRQ